MQHNKKIRWYEGEAASGPLVIIIIITPFNRIDLVYFSSSITHWNPDISRVDWGGIWLSLDTIIISILNVLAYCPGFLQNELTVYCPLIWWVWDFKDFMNGFQVLESFQPSCLLKLGCFYMSIASWIILEIYLFNLARIWGLSDFM